MSFGAGRGLKPCDPDAKPRSAMASFVLNPGAGGSAWYWHRLVPELRRRCHGAVAVELPAADDAAGLQQYADAVVEAIGARRGLVVVAQSMGGFTGPLVCERVPVDLLVLLNAMVPAPGERPGDYWAVNRHAEARAAQAARDGRSLDDDPDLLDAFFHDVPPDVRAAAMQRGAPEQSATPFADPWPLAAWPDVPTRFLQAREDRFFPLEMQRRVVRERLGFDPDEMPGGHLVALSRPVELAERLVGYAAQLGETGSAPGAPASEAGSPR
jgi:pimeloyl-ACP methyl ester carboxylesterase